jgi:hypothetical protein
MSKSPVIMTSIPRLEFDDLAAPLAQALQPRVTRLGYLGEFFRLMGHQPVPLRAFVDFTESAKAPLDKRIVEVIALTVATRKSNAYERNQHERLSVRLGFGREWITEVEALRPDHSQQMSHREKLVQRFVLSAVDGPSEEAQRALETVVEELGHENAVAILMVVGRYVAHAVMVGALGIAPPVPSIYEDGFGLDPQPSV